MASALTGWLLPGHPGAGFLGRETTETWWPPSLALAPFELGGRPDCSGFCLGSSQLGSPRWQIQSRASHDHGAVPVIAFERAGLRSWAMSG